MHIRRRQDGAEKIQHYLCRSSLDIPCVFPERKNCALFLWVTFPQLPEAFRVIKAWGFRYKTVAFVWIKLNRSGQGYFFGLGYWTRSNAEICLLATRGKPKRISKKVFQLIISPLEEHSKKPAEARKRIVELLGITLFMPILPGHSVCIPRKETAGQRRFTIPQ